MVVNLRCSPGQNRLILGRGFDPAATTAAVTTLRDHLLWQTCLASFNDIEQAVAQAIIDGINDNGYFTGDIDEFAINFNSDKISPELVLSVLETIQSTSSLWVSAPGICRSVC